MTLEIENSPQHPEHFDRWLKRYGDPDAYARWRVADPAKAASLAFTAIASDPRILLRLNREAAGKLVGQAQQIIQKIRTMSNATDQTNAAADVVESRVQTWRQYNRSQQSDPSREAMLLKGIGSPGMTDRPASMEHLFSIALHNFPRAPKAVAGTLFKITLGMRAEGLLKLGPPMDVVLSLGAVRLAARSVRGITSGTPETRQKSVEAVGIVQEWGFRADKNPFIMSYVGWEGSVPHQALSLAVDAATCAVLAVDLPGGTCAAGYDLWELAEEFHAYSVLGLNPHLLDNMEVDRAQNFASAAARFATAVIADPGIRMPDFPETCEVSAPKTILALARSVLGDGIRPRRSVATVLDPDSK